MAEVKNYKRKPTVVQAIQFTGNNFNDVNNFAGNRLILDSFTPVIHPIKGYIKSGFFETPMGNFRLDEGDYIVKDLDGMFYPCDEKSFNLLYSLTELPYKIDEQFSDLRDYGENNNEEN